MGFEVLGIIKVKLKFFGDFTNRMDFKNNLINFDMAEKRAFCGAQIARSDETYAEISPVSDCQFWRFLTENLHEPKLFVLRQGPIEFELLIRVRCFPVFTN